MQQDHRGEDEDVKPNQDRRLRPMQEDHDQQQQQQQPQKCPRCESLNTKFCYYNNYSLSQPRYFCKTCRRYWTLGGTLRNVPVGGGCRKGKRTKTSSPSSSSGENSRPRPLSQPQLVQQNLSIPQNMVPVSTTNSGNNSLSPALLRTNKESGNLVSPPGAGISSMGPSYYPGTGFLTSLAAIQSLNNLPTVNLGDLGDHAISNLGLLHGFNTVPWLGSQNHQQHRQFHHVGSATDDKGVGHSFYPPDHQENLIQSSRPGAATSPHYQQQNWHLQGFINNTITNPPVSDTALWSTINTSTTIAANSKDNVNNSIAGAGSSLNHLQDQWPDVPAGFGPPP